tara:strand:- start:112 stop:630 length:519 start_codon:yes stop_codon:yes gene_type:complete
MKIRPDAVSIIEQVLNDPEKDFSGLYPITKITKEDIDNAEILIKAYVKDKEKRAVHFKELEEQRSAMDELDYENFVSSLEKTLKLWDRRFNTRQEIQEKIHFFYPGIRPLNHSYMGANVDPHLFHQLKTLFHNVEMMKHFRNKLNETISDIRKLDLVQTLKDLDPSFTGEVK